MIAARVAMLVLLLAGCAGCAKLHARNQPVIPPLETPPPPARVIVPIESESLVDSASPPVEAPGQPEEVSPRRPVREPTRAAPARSDAPAKPEVPAKADKTEPAPVLPASPATENLSPPLTLQTTANAAEVEQRVRLLLTSAARNLGRVNYSTLSTDSKAQYEIAKRFSEQAEEALKAKNLVFAGQLAEKAASLAALLVQR